MKHPSPPYTFGNIKDFSLTLHRGEIIGFGGLSSCGMHEIGRVAFGLEKVQSGNVTRNGVQIKNSVVAVRQGIGYISKNRDAEALILQGGIGENIVFPSLKDIQKATFISPRAERRMAETEVKAYRIKCQNARQWVNALSGGNKQKVSFAKWTAKNSDVLIMDCPTRGVDIGVKQAMYQIIADMKKQGKAIIIISEELAELIGMVDRLIIMKDFMVQKEFMRSSDLKETDIIEYMIWEVAMEKQVTKIFSKEWILKNAMSLAAYGGLVLCLIIFTVLPPMITQVSIWSPGPFKSIVKHIAVYALMAMGATFVYSLGYMDISIGAQLSMYALLIMLSSRWVGNIWLGVVLCLVISAVCGVINGAVEIPERTANEQPSEHGALSLPPPTRGKPGGLASLGIGGI